MRISTKILTGGLSFGAALCVTSAMAAPNWSAVPAKDVAMFYPGQSGWEFVIGADHSGADKFKAGKNCFACHNGDETNMGAKLVSGQMNEPTPIPGKPGSITAKVQFAHDDQNLYVRLVFAEGNQPNAKMDSSYATKVTMMLDGSVPGATRAGCFYMCHNDSATMPNAGNSARTMYLGSTHAQGSPQGYGDALKPAADLEKLKANGAWLEYWQARLNPGAAAVAVNGTVFDKREEIKPTDVSVDATNSGGTWTVTFTRKLNAGADFVPVVPGKVYTVGFAIHAGHTAKRFHYVSFERTFVLDSGAADFVAAKS